MVYMLKLSKVSTHHMKAFMRFFGVYSLQGFWLYGSETILVVKPTVTIRTIHAGLHPGGEIGAAVICTATCITVLALIVMMRTVLGAVAMVAVAAIITSVKKGWDAG